MQSLGRPTTSDTYKSECDDKSPFEGEGLATVNQLGVTEAQPHHIQDQPVGIDDGFDPAYVKRVVRKVDFRLVPFLAACYSISLIDR